MWWTCTNWVVLFLNLKKKWLLSFERHTCCENWLVYCCNRSCSPVESHSSTRTPNSWYFSANDTTRLCWPRFTVKETMLHYCYQASHTLFSNCQCEKTSFNFISERSCTTYWAAEWQHAFPVRISAVLHHIGLPFPDILWNNNNNNNNNNIINNNKGNPNKVTWRQALIWTGAVSNATKLVEGKQHLFICTVPRQCSRGTELRRLGRETSRWVKQRLTTDQIYTDTNTYLSKTKPSKNSSWS